MRKWTGVSIATFMFAGCQPQQTATTPAAPPAQNDAVAARVSALESQLKIVSRTATRASLGVDKLEKRYAWAEFDPTDPTFQRIDSGVATFAVSMQDVSQFGDGVKLKLNLGNLTAASIVGVTLHINYGPRQPTEDEGYSDWAVNLKNKDAEIVDTLVPGSWNPTTVVLPGIEAKNFGYVGIAIDSKTIALRKR